jgi:DnaJ-domain-containing protein 1
MKLYHPDRVAELGEELQRVAHQKSIDIQRAYKELSR